MISLWVNTLIREYAGKRVLAVTHHLTILAIRAQLERLGPEEFIALDRNEKPINCGVTIYRGDPNQGEDGRLILAQYNQKL
jgi:broad specificity phosphatase PhoE